jgi:hypothetical protein
MWPTQYTLCAPISRLHASVLSKRWLRLKVLSLLTRYESSLLSKLH